MQSSHLSCCSVLQVGMPGEIPEGTRQDLVAPLRMMDGVVQVTDCVVGSYILCNRQ